MKNLRPFLDLPENSGIRERIFLGKRIPFDKTASKKILTLIGFYVTFCGKNKLFR